MGNEGRAKDATINTLKRNAAAADFGSNLSAIFFNMEYTGLFCARSAAKLKRMNSSFRPSICAALTPCSSFRIPPEFLILETRGCGMFSSFPVR